MSESGTLPLDLPAADARPPQALATRPERAAIEVSDRGVILRSFEELQRFAKMILEAGAAPKGIDTLGKVCVAVQMGMERGLAPLGGLRAVFFVNGLPSWRGEAAVALVRQSPLCLYYSAWVEGDGDARQGVCVSHRKGDERAVRTEFSVKDAKKAGLWQKGGPWQEYPDRQLKWRAIGFNLRDQFPDVLGGYPISEEVIDYPAEAFARPPATDRPALAPPPATPDPLLAAIAAPVASTHPADADDAEKEPALRELPPGRPMVKEQLGLPLDPPPAAPRAAALRHYHVRSHVPADEALHGEMRAATQEAAVLAWMKAHAGRWTPPQVRDGLGVAWPLTSVRRAMTNLTAAFELRHWPADRRPGAYGVPNSTWEAR